MRIPTAFPIALALGSLGCVDEEEVCATYDGTLCTELQATVEAQAETIAALESRLAALEESSLTGDDLEGYAQQQDLDDLQDQVDAIADDYVPTADVADAVRLIREDQDETFDNAEDVLAYLDLLDGRRIARDATVTIHLAGGNYAFDEPLVFAHPDGGRIEISGAGVDQTFLTFTSSDGVVIEGASSLGYLGDLTVVGADQEANGLTVRESSALIIGPVEVRGFAEDGIRVEGNSTLESDEGALVEVSGCGYGVEVLDSGFADLAAATSVGNAYDGFYVDLGGFLAATDTQSTGNGQMGYQVRQASGLSAGNSTASSNGDVDYYASYASFILAHEARATDATGHSAFYANAGSYIYANGAIVRNATLTGFAAAYSSSIFASNTDVQGSGTAYFDRGNSYLYALNAVGETTKDSASHDTTDFIYGL
ncbi:MAG: right-handed parallel beta-helix repeat-containing protein [Pseudomonadota bacterium]